ncbi:glycerate kinase [Ornithinicoccus hortensis]|uniref:Glycerate kinase n=1 Tax=Ornithinicoccus hortensis TaxID=82346 RepID=A0A542YU93_9MICO|nr:glycerate kinase [Ornithinicoccus hortensis]TQL51524.1 glycerate kinase [Ornithinicoccus hortensis]
MRVVLAPDKFKGSLTAAEVCSALADGLRRELPEVEVVSVSVADGGDGTVAAVLDQGWQAVTTEVPGPWGDPVAATWAREPDGPGAVLEMAASSGIALAPQDVPSRPDDGPTRALTASTAGTGALFAAALDQGCSTIVLGVGGSATNDGGAGMLSALGARLLDASGHPVPPGAAGLESLDRVDLSGLDRRLLAAEVLLANDVDNPLTGDDGAAAVFGPQKGADPATVARIDAALARWAELLDAALPTLPEPTAGRPGRATARGAGAAGGTGYAAMAVGAQQVSGVDHVLDLVGLDDALEGADLVVTGEGMLDRQTLSGKAPVGVLARARRHGIPVVAVCGHRALTDAETDEVGFAAAYALTDLEPDVERCIEDPVPLLERVGGLLAGHVPPHQPPTSGREETP